MNRTYEGVDLHCDLNLPVSPASEKKHDTRYIYIDSMSYIQSPSENMYPHGETDLIIPLGDVSDHGPGGDINLE